MRGCVYAVAAVLLWSGFILVSRAGGTTALTPYDTAALRFGTAMLILLPIWWRQRRPARLYSKPIIMVAVFGGVLYALLVYSAFKYAPASHAAILLPGLMPFAIAFFAWLVLGERLNRSRKLGLVFMAAGIPCLAWDTFAEAGLAWLGDLLFVLGSFSWAYYTVLVRRLSIGPWEATVGGAIVAASIYLPVYILFLPKAIGAVHWGMILVQSVYQGMLAIILAVLLYMRAVALIGPSGMGAFMALVPAIAGFAAVPLLGESLSLPLAMGLVLVSAGAYVGTRNQRQVILD